MATFRCLHLLFLLLSIVFLMVPKSTSKPNYLYSICPVTKVFAPGSKYQANLNTLFSSLSSNASASSFFSSSANNIVYGLFLCRGDLNRTACSDCVSAATTTDLPKTYCSNRKVAVIWYDECMVRYSNHPVSEIMEASPSVSFINPLNKIGSLTGFTEVLNKTINDVVTRAASDGPGKKFATSELNLAAKGINKTLYAMGQCTPDLNTSACTGCLTEAARNLRISDGARVLQPSCNVRYELYPFFSLSLAPAPAPASVTPSTSPPAPAQAQPPAPTIEQVPTPASGLTPAPPTMSPTMTGNSTAISPGKNQSGQGTHSPHSILSWGIGIFVVLSLNFTFLI